MDGFSDTLHNWQNFYFMVGGAAAALVGLMFVALSMGMHLFSDRTSQEFRVFVTPSVLYFSTVLLVACILLTPSNSPISLGLLLLIGTLIGSFITLQSVSSLIRLDNRYQGFTRMEQLTHIVLPTIAFIGLLVAALAMVNAQVSFALWGLWTMTTLLLFCGIANAWSLVSWIVKQRRP